MHIRLVSIVIATLLAGCASSSGPTVWYNPEHTPSTPANQPARDLAACRMGGVSTGTALGGYNKQSFIASALINDGRKKEYNENCMISKGYMKVPLATVPKGIPFVME